MKRLFTDEQLRSAITQSMRSTAKKWGPRFANMVNRGTTSQRLIQSFIAACPIPGQADCERLVEMAEAGEFDAVLQELISISQN